MDNLSSSDRGKLVSDLKGVIADAEELLRSTAAQAGEEASDVRRRVQAGIARTKSHLADLQGGAVRRARAVSDAADDYVHDNPWRAIIAGAAVGLVLGLLLSRR
jgi:ElaB/YqjD/DUF883 family membrane-anchored ribosome-binding protein